MKLYQAIVQNHRLEGNPELSGSDAVLGRAERIQRLLPRGSGLDMGTKIVSATDRQIVLTTAFHHMDEHGYYAGWTDHTIRVRPSLLYDVVLTISGPNRNQIKDYLHEVFSYVLCAEFDWMAPPSPAAAQTPTP